MERCRVDKEIDSIIPYVESSRRTFVPDPVHSRQLFGPGIFDLKTGRQHVGDDDVADVGIESFVQRKLDDDKIVLFENVAADRTSITIEEAFAHFEIAVLFLVGAGSADTLCFPEIIEPAIAFGRNFDAGDSAARTSGTRCGARA